MESDEALGAFSRLTSVRYRTVASRLSACRHPFTGAVALGPGAHPAPQPAGRRPGVLPGRMVAGDAGVSRELVELGVHGGVADLRPAGHGRMVAPPPRGPRGLPPAQIGRWGAEAVSGAPGPRPPFPPGPLARRPPFPRGRWRDARPRIRLRGSTVRSRQPPVGRREIAPLAARPGGRRVLGRRRRPVHGAVQPPQ
jgi:hypothetical protein